MTSSGMAVGLKFMAGFFLFGAVMCSLTIFLLVVPGTGLDTVWRLNPGARTSFGEMGWPAITLMVVVGAACAATAMGLFRRREWGRRLGILVLTVNLLGDLLAAIVRHDPRTLIGLPIAGAMILFLHRTRGAYHERGR